MNANDELATIIRLACLTEHRGDDEQRALINMAWRCDVTHNQLTVNGLRARRAAGDKWEWWDLTALVNETRTLIDDDKPIPPPKGRAKRWETWRREGAMVRG